jgi:hypothetical protein
MRSERIELPIFPVPLMLFPHPWLGALSVQGCASSPRILITRELDPPECCHDFPWGEVMVRSERIELPTPSLGNLCSIQLSYERVQ